MPTFFAHCGKTSGHNESEFDGDVLSDAKPTLLHAFRILTLSAHSSIVSVSRFRLDLVDPKMRFTAVCCLFWTLNCLLVLSKPLAERQTLVNRLIDLIKREHIKLNLVQSQKTKKGLESTPLGKSIKSCGLVPGTTAGWLDSELNMYLSGQQTCPVC